MSDLLARGMANAKVVANISNNNINLQTTSAGSQIQIPIKPGGKNLFDKNSAIKGYYANWTTNGSLAEGAGFYASDYIEVEGNTLYSRKYDASICYFNASKTFISGLTASGLTFTTPVNCRYIKINPYYSMIPYEQVEKGTSTTLEAYYGKPSLKQDTPFVVTQLQLPAKIYALVGQEVNIYFDNLMADDASKYDWDVAVSPALPESPITNFHQDERWTYIPGATAPGTYTLTITAYRDKEFVVATGTTSLIVTAAAVGSGISRACLFIGDSTLAGGEYTSELLTLFGAGDVMDITLIGTQGSALNLHEGRSGQTVAWFYTNAASPFVKAGVFNFPQYMADNSFAAVDRIGIMLGINDIFALTTDAAVTALAATAITQLEGMITSMKAFNAAVKVGIMCTIPPSAHQDAFGDDYGAGQTRWRYKRNLMLWDRALINQFGGREASSIYVVPVNVNLDTEHNMSFAGAAAANSRTATTVNRQSNGIHPATDGYEQIADTLYYFLKSFEV